MARPTNLYFGVPATGATPTTAATVVYTSPTGMLTSIESLTVTNTTGSAATFTLYRVPSGGSIATASMIQTASVPANSSTNVLPVWNLNVGDAIYAYQGTANALTVSLDGFTYGSSVPF